jgi:TldD protein
MKELAELALDTVKRVGATYGDIRLIESVSEFIQVKNGSVKVLKRMEDRGFGIRVIRNGAWGFAASSLVSRESIQRTADLAVKVAESSARLKVKDVHLGEAPKAVDRYETGVKIDPFAVSVDKKIDLLLESDKAMRKVKGVKLADSRFNAWKTTKLFASSEGSLIEQVIVESGGGITATAVKDGETGSRTYPGFLGGHYKTMGYEFVESLRLPENAERIAEEAVAVLAAREIGEMNTTIVVDGPMVAIQIHETVGHPTELDRVFGTEVSLAGTSHLTPDKLGKLQFASDMVNITADATIKGGLGSFGYDDEGVSAQKSYLVKDGVFTGYLTSRETSPLVGRQSNGTMRAAGWDHIPLIRMTNINLEPGNWKLEDLIADTEEGIYIVSPTAPSIDDKRLNYHVSTEAGWLIRKGKLTEMVKRPSYSGISYEIWRNCDAICCSEEWEIWGVPNCGKGEPMQLMHVAHGASPARFRNVSVGRRK